MCISDFVWILRFHIAFPQSLIPQQTQEIQPPVSHPIFMLCVSTIVQTPPPPYGNPVFRVQPRTVARTVGSQNHGTEIGNIRHPFVSLSCGACLMTSKLDTFWPW